MMGKGIVGKLFLLTAAFFIFFLLLEGIFFKFFLNEFYIYRKVQTVEENMAGFVQRYSQGIWSFKQAIDETELFAQQNNAAIVIINDAGIPVHGSSRGLYSLMTVEDESGRYYQVYLDYLKESPAFQGFEARAGDQLIIEGVSYEESKDYIEPYAIQSSSGIFAERERLADYRDPETGLLDEGVIMVEVMGTVVYVQEMPEISQYENIDPELYRQELLMRHISDWMAAGYTREEVRDSLNNGGTVQEEFADPVSGVKYEFFVRQIPGEGELRYACTVVSLQPINEAMELISDYYVYYLLLAALFIILLSFFYSRMIARPLIQMNEVAGRMANLDFAAVSEVRSRDELGQLSSSLNSLSHNLNQSLNELKRLNEQLQSDIEKERRQEEKRREFVTGISHELKTPLGIIKSYAEGIKDGIYTEKRDHYLDVIVDEIEKMDALVIEMLDLSNLESASIKLNPSIFILDELVEACGRNFMELLAERGQRFVFEAGCHYVKADRRRIEQVLGNLISNAVRYSDAGAVISVRLASENGFVYTWIENSGVHIDEKEIPRIWERFYRVDKSRSRELGGTGLGLLIVRNIMELHQSDYGVRNTDRGVEFYFALPEASPGPDGDLERSPG